MVDIYTIAFMILATVITFGLYTVLTGVDNPFFSFAEYSYVGAAVGLLVVMSLVYLQQKVFTPMMTNPASNWPIIISFVLGLLVLTRISTKYSYIARIPLSIAIAIGIGISTRTLVFTDLLAQIRATILPLWGVPTFTAFTNILILFFVGTTLLFYLYTIEKKGTVKNASSIGRYVLYAGFGALFAQTFMGRIGLFLGRMQTMLFPADQFYLSLGVSIMMIVTIIILYKRAPELLRKITPE